jgi:uncharacterized membrane protein
VRFLLGGLVAAVLLIALRDREGDPLAALGSLVLLWFLPGYAIQEAALYRVTPQPNAIERAVLSVGASLAVLGLSGVIIDAASVSVRGSTVAIAVSIVTEVACFAGLLRSLRAGDVRLSLPIRRQLLPASWAAALLAIGIAIAGSLAVLVWKAPPVQDTFTELAVLDRAGGIPSLPVVVGDGEPTTFRLLTVSQEPAASEYAVRVSGPAWTGSSGPMRFSLEPGQGVTVDLRVAWRGVGQQWLVIELDRGTQRAYRSLRLAIEVVSP